MRSTPRLGSNRQRAGVALAQNLKAAMRGDGGRWVAVASIRTTTPGRHRYNGQRQHGGGLAVWPSPVCDSLPVLAPGRPVTSDHIFWGRGRGTAFPGMGGPRAGWMGRSKMTPPCCSHLLTRSASPARYWRPQTGFGYGWVGEKRPCQLASKPFLFDVRPPLSPLRRCSPSPASNCP